MNSLISIGIPIVKANYLEHTIQSVLAQTYDNIEIIISCDPINLDHKNRIQEILNNFDDTRIRYFQTTRKLTMVENWNTTLSKAKGQYFQLLCDDDEIKKTFIEQIISLTSKYPKVNVFHTRFEIINEKNKIIDFSPTMPEYENCIDFMWHRFKGYRSHTISDLVFKTDKLKKIGGFYDLPLGWGSDNLTAILCAQENGIVFLNKPLFRYRRSDVTTSKKGEVFPRIEALNLFHEKAISLINEYNQSKIYNKEHLFKALELYINKGAKELLNIQFHSGNIIKNILFILKNKNRLRKQNIKNNQVFKAFLESTIKKLHFNQKFLPRKD